MPERGGGTAIRDVGRTAPSSVLGLVVPAILPFVAAAVLSTTEFAMWALLSTVARAGQVFDLGATVYVQAHLARSLQRRRLVYRGLVASCTGAAAVGGLAFCTAWLGNFRGFGAQTDGLLMLIVAVSLGSVLRSIAFVGATAALSRGWYSKRDRILLGSSGAFGVCGLFGLWGGLGVWALPVGMLAGGVLGSTLAVGAILEQKNSSGASGALPKVGPYVRRRTLISGASALLQEGDRWVIGGIIGPEALAVYELATRIATLPRMFVLAASPVVVTRAAVLSKSSVGDLTAAYRGYRNLLAGLGAAGIAACLGMVFLLAKLGVVAPEVVVVGSVLLGLQVLGLIDVPKTYFRQGLGDPSPETRRLSIGYTIWFALAVIGMGTGVEHLIVFAAPIGLAVGSAYFMTESIVPQGLGFGSTED